MAEIRIDEEESPHTEFWRIRFTLVGGDEFSSETLANVRRTTGGNGNFDGSDLAQDGDRAIIVLEYLHRDWRTPTAQAALEALRQAHPDADLVTSNLTTRMFFGNDVRQVVYRSSR